MTTEYIIGLFVLALSLSWTPGPNNALLAASGARYGFVRTMPHSFGVVLGFGLMMFLIGAGLSQVFRGLPLLREILRWVGAAILLWIAFKLATAKLPENDESVDAKPWTFLKGAAFQWINPKAWIMAISIAGSAPSTQPSWLSPLMVALVFTGVGFSSANGWALFGTALQRFISTPLRYRIFNLIMAAMILLTVIGILFADLSAGSH